MGNIKYIKQHNTLEIFYPIVKSEGIVDAWTIMNEDIYNLFYPRVESISIAKDSISVTPFSSTTIKYTIIPKDAYNQKVSWSVDDTSIASVSDGAVSGKFPGTTTVSVKSASGGHTDTVEIISQCGDTDLLYVGSVNLTDRLADVSSILPVYSKQFGAARLYDHIYSIPADFASECDIKALQLPSTITEIGDYAFLYNKIANINIPAQVSLLGTDVFAGNDPISIVVEAENTVYDSRNNCNALILTDNNTLLLGSVNTVIPEDVTSIAACSFERSSIANIDIPASVVNIDNSAFTDCSELESINVSADNEVYSSIEGALYNKDQSILLNVPHKVKSLVIPHTCTISEIDVLNTNFPYVESFNSGGLVGELSATPFQGHSNIKTVVLGTGITKLNMEAFRMSSLENITMSEGLQIIDPRPFDYCGQLKSITIPSSVVDVNASNYGFGSGLNSLESFVVAEGNPIYDSRDNCNAFIETDTNTLLVGFPISTIPDSIVTIGDGAFEANGCGSHIVIPEGVTIIGSHAFYNCSSLESVIIPNNVTLMGIFAFYGCTSLNAVTIGNSITDIGDHTFYNCSSLTSVTIPEGVIVIDPYAFSSCDSLVSVTLPASIATIANKAFYNSGNLSEMNYAGTMENWANVSCGSDWISGTNITSINCSDGVINL